MCKHYSENPCVSAVGFGLRKHFLVKATFSWIPRHLSVELKGTRKTRLMANNVSHLWPGTASWFTFLSGEHTYIPPELWNWIKCQKG